MSGRRLYLDKAPGEARGVVALDGRPERLLIERDGEPETPRLGGAYRARVRALSGDRRLAFLDLGDGLAGAAAVGKGAAPAVGALVRAEVAAEARADKAAVLRILGPAEGAPGPAAAAPTLEARLKAFAPEAAIETGPAARELADEAEEAILSPGFDLGGGLKLWIEPTRAVVGVDVDWSGDGALPGGKAVQANRRAVREAARLLRLKALAGSIIIDLIGFPGPDDAVRAEARAAFADDGPGVSVLPTSRLGLLQVSKPHRERPRHEMLCDSDGAPSARTIAQRLVRGLQREGAADPGARLTAACSPEVAQALEPLVQALGPRFGVTAELGWPRDRTDIRSS